MPASDPTAPGRVLGWAAGKGAQELALGLDEAGQGLLVGGAVDPVAGGAEQPHARKHLTIFEHLEPPIGHRHLPLSDCAGTGTGEKWWSETSAQHCRSGSIKANTEWLHIGGH